MPTREQLRALVDEMPAADDRGMYTKQIDKQRIEKAVAEILRGSRDGVLGLIDMLGEPGSPQDVKPRYALHCVVNRALIEKDKSAQEMLSETLAAALKSDRPKHVKAFLCQELQWAGTSAAAPALGTLLLDEDLVEAAAMALVAIRQGAADQFRAALPAAKGKCRLSIVQGLGAVEDPASIPALRAALQDSDADVRLAAGWGLARLADAGSADLLLQAADAERGWNRSQATKHCLLLAEKLAATGNKGVAAKIYRHLAVTRTDAAERYIRSLAEKALSAEAP